MSPQIIQPVILSLAQRVARLPKLQGSQDFRLHSEQTLNKLKDLLTEKVKNAGIPEELTLIETYKIENTGNGIDLIIKNSPRNIDATEAVILRVKTFPRGNYAEVNFIHWKKDDEGEKEGTKKVINFRFLPGASMVSDIYLETFLDTFSNEITKWTEENQN